MRALPPPLRILPALAALTALLVGGLWLFVPAHTGPDDGRADPILDVRRPVVRWLRDVGVLPGRVPFFGDPYLPTVATSTLSGPAADDAGAAEDEGVTHRITVRREPVYRGLFWLVGDRIRYEQETLGDDRHDLAALRLCHEAAGRRELAGEGTVENGQLDPTGRRARVRGFVPHAADAYWIEALRPDGSVEAREWWGRSPAEVDSRDR